MRNSMHVDQKESVLIVVDIYTTKDYEFRSGFLGRTRWSYVNDK